MNKQKACRILGITKPIGETALKKIYHELMQLTHPDNGAENSYPYDVREINEAYDYLKKRISPDGKITVNPAQDTSDSKKDKKQHSWNAPVNDRAFAPRDIFHNVEGEDGRVLGKIKIDRGKFYWTKEEEFSLFLKSLFSCSRHILNDAAGRPYGSAVPEIYLRELSFLLARQFINHQAVLDDLADKKENSDGETIYSIFAMLEPDASGSSPSLTGSYHISAMLEPDASGSSPSLTKSSKGKRNTFQTGKAAQSYAVNQRATGKRLEKSPEDLRMLFYPSKLQHHRLYLQSETGEITGYVSFRDDRFYYILIPLFEEHRVQVRFTSDAVPRNLSRGKVYYDLLLEMKFLSIKKPLPENTNLQIEKLLKKFLQETGVESV